MRHICCLSAALTNYDNIPHQIGGIKGLFDVRGYSSSCDVCVCVTLLTMSIKVIIPLA